MNADIRDSDALDEIFNAFKPGSQMDVRSMNIPDPDRRVKNRISLLSKKETGKMEVISLAQNGNILEFSEQETILLARLKKPLLPGKKTKLQMTFKGRVPKQIRRSGRNNNDGVALSMTQWYPKLCEFDHHGWHSNPYIGREFHGIWSHYDVRLHVPKGYVVAATGVQASTTNKTLPDGTPGSVVRFKADNVIDFAWAADPDFVEETFDVDGVTLRLVHQASPELDSNWTALGDYAARAMAFINEDIGPYMYPEYNVVQGGDGGPGEAAMARLNGGDDIFHSVHVREVNLGC